MPIVLKKLRLKFKRKLWKKVEENRKPLVSDMISPLTEAEEEDPQSQDSSCINMTNQFIEDFEINTQDTEPKEEKILSILKDVLIRDMKPEELIDAAKQVKKWAKLNGITPKAKWGFTTHSSDWLREYHKAVQMSVDQNFPIPPPNKPSDIEKYLTCATSLVCSKVTSLVPVLEDAGLLSYLVDSYNQRLFAVLDLLMDISSSVPEVSCLLTWVNQTYFSRKSNGPHNIQDGVFDPLLLTTWFEKAKQKFLQLIQDYISNTLQNVLLYSETQSVCDYKDEEALIKVHLDVIQCLHSAVQRPENISKTLKNAVQRLCCDELHSFVQRYVNTEMKRLKAQKTDQTNFLQCYSTIGTCRQLRLYALTIVDSDNNADSSTLLMLKNMEAQVSSSVEQWLESLAMDHLKKYFKQRDVHMYELMSRIQHVLAPLPQIGQEEETKQHIVHSAYRSVTRAYLQCLIQNKCKHLEKRWGNMEKKMMQDANIFHGTFSQLGNSNDKQKILLMRMSEVLGCNNMDILKLICSALYKDFSDESKEFLPVLLRWRNSLSKRQIREVLDVIQDVCQNNLPVKPHPLRSWSCCL